MIKLGPGNDAAARAALAAWPHGLQVGGGIHAGNAQEWLDAGAEKARSLTPTPPSMPAAGAESSPLSLR